MCPRKMASRLFQTLLGNSFTIIACHIVRDPNKVLAEIYNSLCDNTECAAMKHGFVPLRLESMK